MTRPNALTLSRSSLYELVWSKPMTEVAKDFGLSDVGVAKRCKEVQVPVPPRGWWARKAAGQDPPRTPLPKYRSSSMPERRAGSILAKHEGTAHPEFPKTPEPAVTFHLKPAPSPENEHDQTPELSPIQAALETKLENLGFPVDAPRSWLDLYDRHTSPPGWSETLRGAARLPPFSVHSKASTARARRLLTQMVQVVTQIGWQFIPSVPEDPERPYYRCQETAEEIDARVAHFEIEGERLYVNVTERQSRSERPLTAEEENERRKNKYFYRRDRYRYMPTGELTVQIRKTVKGYDIATFRDSKRSPLEARIGDIVRSLLRTSVDIKARRKEEAQAAERERLERIRQEQIQETREAYRKLVSQFEADAGAWERAQRLRRYLRAARRALGPGSHIRASIKDEKIDLLELGAAFANQLDPLHPESRTPNLFNQRDVYGTGVSYASDDSNLRSFLSRILGGDWSKTAKYFSKKAEP
jgi:hypothetical protein